MTDTKMTKYQDQVLTLCDDLLSYSRKYLAANSLMTPDVNIVLYDLLKKINIGVKDEEVVRISEKIETTPTLFHPQALTMFINSFYQSFLNEAKYNDYEMSSLSVALVDYFMEINEDVNLVLDRTSSPFEIIYLIIKEWTDFTSDSKFRAQYMTNRALQKEVLKHYLERYSEEYSGVLKKGVLGSEK